MSIRIETSKKRDIDNSQLGEILDGQMMWFRDLPKLHPKAKKRTSPSPLFNCHGLTFASRRSKITKFSDIQCILEDDKWHEIPMKDILPGDVVIYFDDEGDASHSGVVVEYSPLTLIPSICSKWGYGPEFVHNLNDVPKIYGSRTQFYRCFL